MRVGHEKMFLCEPDSRRSGFSFGRGLRLEAPYALIQQLAACLLLGVRKE
jgi:hypothetical protein